MAKLDTSKERLQELLNNAIEYIAELKGNEDLEERIDFYKDVIGMNDEELEFYDLNKDW